MPYYARTVYRDVAAGETNFDLDFQYSDALTVSVEVDGSSVGFSWLNDATVILDQATAGGETVIIKRTTDLNERSVDFANAAELNEEDLDKSAQQVFDAMQEIADIASDSLTPQPDGSLSLGGRLLRDLADPLLDTDAVTKQYVDARIATSAENAQIALTSAESASEDAATASSAAVAALNARDIVTNLVSTFVNVTYPNAVAAIQQARDDALAIISQSTSELTAADVELMLEDFYDKTEVDGLLAGANFLTPAQADAAYLGINATAQNAANLGGVSAATYARLDVAQAFAGVSTFNGGVKTDALSAATATVE